MIHGKDVLMRRSRFTLAVIALLIVTGLLAGCDSPLPAPPSPTAARPSATAEWTLPCAIPAPPSGAGSACTPAPRDKWVQATVVSITDGDTIQVRIGGETRKLRYIGMDTPERGQPGYTAAKDVNAELVAGQTVYLEKDCREDDGERLLRYVWLADGRMVNEELVRMGVALAVAYTPDTRHRWRLEQAAFQAWQEESGFWAGGADAFPYAIVAVNALPVLQGPGEEQPVKGTVMCGDALAVYGRSADGGWLQVRGPDRTGGWVRATGVELAVPLDAVAVE
jgi:endonuclease YncB( thermonuclease family)